MQNYMLVPQQGVEPADEWIKLGVEAQVANRLDDAERHYRQALRADPRNAIATMNFAILYAQRGNLNEALLTIERAAMFDKEHAVIEMNRALMLLDADRIDEAIAAGRHAVEMKPQVETWLALALTLATAGHAGEAVPLYNKILDEQPSHPLAGPNCCFIQTLAFCTPQELLAQRKRWYDGNRYKGTIKGHADHDRSWPRPLRVGYVSPDFKTHSASMIFRNVLLHHDHNVVLPFYYSCLPVDPNVDPFTKQFVDAAGDRWRDISQKNDDEAERAIRNDQIDILVDLASHTNGGRLTLFTRKPAPVQVHAWGFAHGTGLPEIDWFFADKVSVPDDERQFFAEKIYDLPCLLTYEDIGQGGPDNQSDNIPFRQNGYITFGSSARYEKLSLECLKTFSEIMKRVPDAVLRLKDSAYRRPYAIKRVTEAMPDIDPKRLHFLIQTNHPEHMAAYRSSDLQLDPYPHGGGVVALEQIFMGVPLVTMYGTQPSGRNTASILSAMGRSEWIAKSEAEYVEIACRLADDVKTLRATRKSLRSELLNSPVVKGYREAVENAYRDIWEKFIGRRAARQQDNEAPVPKKKREKKEQPVTSGNGKSDDVQPHV